MDDKIKAKTRDAKTSGRCIISNEVIATIASRAALEVPGVTEMAGAPVTLKGLVKSSAERSVVVSSHENTLALDVYIHIAADGRIQEIGTAVQQGVKSAVQAMTGRPVTRVNVHIAGIVLEDKAQ